MLSRRTLLKSALIATAGARHVFAFAAQPSTVVNFQVPAGACDTHVHVFDDPRRFPFAPTRGYTPETASVEELRALHKALHIQRVVVVQASVYGTDNSCTLDAIRRLGSTARGIAVIDEKTSSADLDKLHSGGIRGLRVNLSVGRSDLETARSRFRIAARRAQERGFHIQLNLPLTVLLAFKEELMASPVPLVLDHFAGAQASQGLQQTGFPAVLDLVRSGKSYIKISAAYRSSNRPPQYADMAPLAKALIAANPQRILWGTDWPHPNSAPPPGGKPTDVTPLYPIDDGILLNQFALWVPDPAQRKLILVDNPARLYGF